MVRAGGDCLKSLRHQHTFLTFIFKCNWQIWSKFFLKFFTFLVLMYLVTFISTPRLGLFIIIIINEFKVRIEIEMSMPKKLFRKINKIINSFVYNNNFVFLK